MSKHKALENSYQIEVDAGNTDLQPQLTQIQDKVNSYQSMLDIARINPEVANAPALGYVDVKISREAMTTLVDGGVRSQIADLPTSVITDASLNIDYPNAKYVGADEPLQIKGEIISNLGVDLSANKSFRQAGGEVFVDADSNAVVLAVNMVTKEDGSTLTRVEVPYEKVNGEWRADFSRYNALAGEEPVRLAEGLAHNRGPHFSNANKQLASLIERTPTLQSHLGLTNKDIDNLSLSKISPEPYTWHHVNADGDMMLVDSNIRHVHPQRWLCRDGKIGN